MTTFTNDQLFNCCTAYAEPDWLQFNALELGGCVNLDDEGSTEGGCEREDADFFTVYGHLKTGGVEAITDVVSFDEAVAIAEALAGRASLEVNVVC